MLAIYSNQSESIRTLVTENQAYELSNFSRKLNKYEFQITSTVEKEKKCTKLNQLLRLLSVHQHNASGRPVYFL